jgi:nicotinamidase-related amidase
MRINRENTLTVIIDFQEKLVPTMSRKDILIKNSVTLIKGLRMLQIPILVTQQNTQGLGTTIPEIISALGNFTCIEKMTFSCLREPEFKKALEKNGKRHILIFGIEAHICILQTTLDLLDNNFNPMIVEDCIGSSDDNDKRIALWRMRDAGSQITTYESILFELCGEAGTNDFRNILELIKERKNA